MAVAKTIAELPDGKLTINSNALIAFEQDGATFNASVRPNPPNQINARNQAQLEAILGTNLEIPDEASITVVIDDTFPLTKPFKGGLNSRLEIFASNTGTSLIYGGGGSIFQNTNPSNPIRSLLAHDFTLIGDGTNSVLDIRGTSGVQMARMRWTNFDSIGATNNPLHIYDTINVINVKKGLVLTDVANLEIRRFIVSETGGETDITYLSIISKTLPTTIDITALTSDSPNIGDTLVFFDPNSLAGSDYRIINSDASVGDFYQQGSDIIINSVANNGSGKARFTTAASHNLVVGRPTVISGFVVNAVAYNITGIVTAVDTPLTGTTFDVDEITFGTDESGGK